MDFDGLDDILEDNAYVPSFAAREPKKNESIKSRKNSAMQNQSTPLSVAPPSTNNNKSGGLFGLHKQSSRNEPSSFEQFFNRQKQAQKKNNESSLQKNKSASNFNIQKLEKQDDADSIFSAQRTTTRRPLSKQKQSEKQSQKIQVEPAAPRRGMKPPLSKKNQSTRNDLGVKMDTNNSFDLTDNFNTTKQVVPKYVDKLDPLESLKAEEAVQMKKFLEQQIQYQKKTMENILEEERQSKKKQIQSIKRNHQQELKKKLELKDYELSKQKQFYEMQLSLKQASTAEKKQFLNTNEKIQENIKQLKKIETRMNEQYSLFQNKQSKQNDLQFQRKQNNLQRRENQVREKERRLEQLQKQLKAEKVRIIQEQDRERNRLNQLALKTNQKQNQLESKFKRKQKDLTDQYEKKRSDLDHQKEKMRYQSLQIQQKKMQLDQQQRELKKKVKTFEDRQKEILEQLHQQRTKQMEKQIQISSITNDLSMKQTEVEMQRQELTNKLKILELERKKLQIQSKGSLKNAFPSAQSPMDRAPTWNKRDPKVGLGSSFQSYQKSIAQMRDQLMKSIPKF